MASAVAIAMLLLLVVPIMMFQHFQNKELEAQSDESAAMKTRGLFSKTVLGLGFVFLYVPDPVDDRLLVQRLAAR